MQNLSSWQITFELIDDAKCRLETAGGLVIRFICGHSSDAKQVIVHLYAIVGIFIASFVF